MVRPLPGGRLVIEQRQIPSRRVDLERGNSPAFRIVVVVNFTGRIEITVIWMECEKARFLHSGGTPDELEVSCYKIKFSQINPVAVRPVKVLM